MALKAKCDPSGSPDWALVRIAAASHVFSFPSLHQDLLPETFPRDICSHGGSCTIRERRRQFWLQMYMRLQVHTFLLDTRHGLRSGKQEEESKVGRLISSASHHIHGLSRYHLVHSYLYLPLGCRSNDMAGWNPGQNLLPKTTRQLYFD